MADHLYVGANVIHVFADVFEVGFQFNDARFQINSSSGITATFAFVPSIGPPVPEGRALSGQQLVFTVMHGTVHPLGHNCSND
ncbi:hypothetical protein D3C78_1339360 [compost metagenome]